MGTPTKYTPEQQSNITAIVVEGNSKGITNQFAIASILSIVSKETGFKYKAESSYRSTPNIRIRKIFGKRVAMYSEVQLTALKQNDPQFFDAVYGYKTEVGRKNGNTSPGDGWKYRGRGPNQITFKSLYAKLGKQIGIDLINNPDLANTPAVAAKIVIQYMLNAFNAAKNIKATINVNNKPVKVPVLSLYNSTGINDFKTLPDSVGAFYHANAGWGKTPEAIKLDQTGGLKKAKDASGGFYQFVANNKVAVAASGGGAFFFTDGLSDSDNIETEEKETREDISDQIN